MDKRFFLFLAVSMVILVGSQAIINSIFPPPERPAPKVGEDAVAEKQQKDKSVADREEAADRDSIVPGVVAKPVEKGGDSDSGKSVEGQPKKESIATQGAQSPQEKKHPLSYVSLGSLDPSGNSRALVTLTSLGASIERLELNNPRYRDMVDTSGYLGHLVGKEVPEGFRVDYVGRGTPADQAGLRIKDIIVEAGGDPVEQQEDLSRRLQEMKAGQQLQLVILRDGQRAGPLDVTLIRRPLEIVRPEMNTQPIESYQPTLHDPFSLLLTLSQIDQQQLLPEERVIEGAELHEVNWAITKSGPLEVRFEKELPAHGLIIIKHFQLAEVPDSEIGNEDYKAYHLFVDLTIKNQKNESREIAYRLDGPTGMPTEGWWYSRKISRTWGGAALRDVAAHSLRDGPNLIAASRIVDDAEEEETTVNLQMPSGETNPLAYLGVETQYFAAILIPFEQDATEQDDAKQSYKSYKGIGVGDKLPEKSKLYLTNVTSQLTSVTETIEPNGEFHDRFQFFTGPKRRSLLKKYSAPNFPEPVDLSELIYYGWPIWGFFARPLSDVLQFFYRIIPNYGIAIILLTVVVRLCMFPLSRKQALNAQKMQELQPEIKKITEKYKGEMEKRSKALQELYRKHKYNPMSGCFPLFIQLPIFIGLYRALMTDVTLRQAPLISSSISWANNLAAPDMLWRWDKAVPIGFLTSSSGWLGPYLNVLPLVTVVLFVVQQKMFMPPPTDDQSAMQQKIMKYMMVFMGFLFFKVPSGLCLYFIVSSLWGLGERKLLPKIKKGTDHSVASTALQSEPKAVTKSGSGGSQKSKSQKKRRRKNRK
ncbi:MAG: YidC/Oxa1 family insertase periplasmic-domain containing protein [Pirellulales bacterium]|nr:YidC/Oxa1 family insertase periplasmic-domain containing protein [Pirellulales bacterium]